MPRDWYTEIGERLRDYSDGEVWYSGLEILCRTKEGADAIADLIWQLYATDDNEVVVKTGYYDPSEDERNNQVDRFTGWWYVDI